MPRREGCAAASRRALPPSSSSAENFPEARSAAPLPAPLPRGELSRGAARQGRRGRPRGPLHNASRLGSPPRPASLTPHSLLHPTTPGRLCNACPASRTTPTHPRASPPEPNLPHGPASRMPGVLPDLPHARGSRQPPCASSCLLPASLTLSLPSLSSASLPQPSSLAAAPPPPPAGHVLAPPPLLPSLPPKTR